jgi:ribosomal protein S18 acetylase RimI-like enzyme
MSSSRSSASVRALLDAHRLTARSADVAAAWHAAWLAALGLRSERTARVWRALDQPPPIYWTAVALESTATAADLAGQPGTVCDPWSSIDLTPHGYAATARDPWLARTPGKVGVAVPPELELVRAQTPAQVAEFETTSIRGFFEDESAEIACGSIHPAPILDDERMTMLIGRVEGRPVAAAMSYRLDDVVGIYGVTTLPSVRRRGYASALTAALLDPGVPASLSPSAMAAGVYRRLGFEQVGELTMWSRLTPTVG